MVRMFRMVRPRTNFQTSTQTDSSKRDVTDDYDHRHHINNYYRHGEHLFFAFPFLSLVLTLWLVCPLLSLNIEFSIFSSAADLFFLSLGYTDAPWGTRTIIEVVIACALAGSDGCTPLGDTLGVKTVRKITALHCFSLSLGAAFPVHWKHHALRIGSLGCCGSGSLFPFCFYLALY